MQAQAWQLKADRAGVILSSACAVHCALMPIAATLLPLVGLGMLATEGAETALLVAAGVLAAVAIGAGSRRHRGATPLLLAAAGLAIILAARVVFEVSESGERIAVVSGACLLALAHLTNARLLRRQRLLSGGRRQAT